LFLKFNIFYLLFFCFFLSCLQESNKQSFYSISDQIVKDSLNSDLYYQRGIDYYNSYNYDYAIYDFRNANRLDSLNIHYKLYLAFSLYESYKKNKDTEYLNNALIYFQEILSSKDTSFLSHDDNYFNYKQIKYASLTNICEIYTLLSEYDKSFICIDNMEKEKPLDYYSYYLRGFVLENLQQIDQAMYYYHKSISLNESHFDSYFKIGFINHTMNDSACIYYYNEAFKIDSNNINLLYNIAKYYQDNFYFNYAIKYYNKILVKDQFNENANYSLAYIYFYLKDYEQSANYASEVIYSNNQNHFAYNIRFMCFKNLGRLEEAIRDSLKCEQLKN